MSRKGRTTKRTKLGRVTKTKRGPQKKCAKNSLRALMPPGRPDVRIILCCPPGEWSKGRGKAAKPKCKVSLKKHASKHYAVKRR